MRTAWLPLIAALAGCATTGRVDRLEHRVAAAEEAQARSEFEARAAQARIEEMLGQLAAAVTKATEAGERAAALERQLDVVAQGVRPPPPPQVPPARRGPDLALTYAVPVGDAPVRGKPTALVTIIRAGEYACPYCERVRDTLTEVSRLYGDKVRIVYKTFVVHPQVATYPAQAACAANRQGKFWQLDRLLWDEAYANRKFDPASIDALAAKAGLDPTRYQLDVAGPCVRIVADEMAELSKFAVTGTPAFFINGRFLSGAQPIEAFKALIDEELAKAQAAVKRGVKPAKYYQQEIVDKGLPGVP
ncbi:MAG: thioredoxin domain-containing protein [Kofleriaceae bacterium]